MTPAKTFIEQLPENVRRALQSGDDQALKLALSELSPDQVTKAEDLRRQVDESEIALAQSSNRDLDSEQSAEVADSAIANLHLTVRKAEDIDPFRLSRNTVPPREIQSEMTMGVGPRVKRWVPVWYVTTRNRLGTDRRFSGFGIERGNEKTPVFGLARVPVSRRRRRRGQELYPPNPWWLWPFPRERSPSLDLSPRTDSTFWRELSKMSSGLQAKHPKQALLYIHGFRVTFDEAMQTAARLALDLGICGPTICYSWASAGRLASYASDTAAAGAATPFLRDTLLPALHEHLSAAAMTVIAHSMGNRPLLAVLSELGRQFSPLRLQHAFFASPDIDSNVFEFDAVSMKQCVKEQATLYVTTHDKALKCSRSIYGAARAGLILPVVDVGVVSKIDVSNVDPGIYGHSAYIDSPVVLDDIIKVIHHNVTPGAPSRPMDATVGMKGLWVLR